MDNDGGECIAGQVGEIYTRGDNVFRGYLNQEKLTKEVLADGWFRTGDLGYLDEEGYLYLKDRKQDLIVTGGENVYSSEVEDRIEPASRLYWKLPLSGFPMKSTEKK